MRYIDSSLTAPATMVGLSLLLAATIAPAADDESAPVDDAARRSEFFEQRIRPVLIEHCYECHNSADTAEGRLAVDWRRPLRKGGDRGAAVVPGKPDESLLLKVVRHEIDDLEMPSGGPRLDQREIDDIERWIRDGAVDPRTSRPSEESIGEATSWEAKFARRKQWWSLQPLNDPAVPEIGEYPWSAHPVDRFIAAALGGNNLTPQQPADPATLVRRYYFTLIGLPPTAEEFDQWTQRLAVDDPAQRDMVVAELVDDLLDSPHFGERWARHWMDWLRYAESHGSEGDPAIAGAWHYRDYLIRALNADVPYDQLVREHVAGDLLDEPRVNETLGINESLIGTAHWRMVFHGFAPTDALDERVRFTDDQIDVFSKAFLGLTVSCARCHDHKFDAISQADYYALFGILRSARPGRAVIDVNERQAVHRDELRTLKPQIRAAITAGWLNSVSALEQSLLASDGPVAKAEQPSTLLHDLYVLRNRLSADGESEAFGPMWQQVLQRREQTRSVDEPTSNTLRNWRLDQPGDYADWYHSGIGLPTEPAEPGAFAVAPDGHAALAGIYPGGVYTNAVSGKHAARLSSPDVSIDDDYELWIRATGGGGATVRYAVHDYPRSGTVYPVNELGDWKWQRYDLSYWNGEEIHVELATAADAPLLVKDSSRSWFGVREVIVARKGTFQPAELQSRDALLDLLAEQGAPQSFDELVKLSVDALTAAVKRWRDERATDADAIVLHAAMNDGLLPNRLDALPEAEPLVREYRRLEAAIPVPIRVPALEQTPNEPQPLYTRGNHRQPAEEVPSRFLSAIDAKPYESGRSARLQLAEDLLREDNPLTRRVIVNRVWHHVFGAGLVRTPDNFGRLGDQPSHPELLDWLSRRFSQDGWSLKQLIRLLATSRTFQLDSQPSVQAQRIDPDNRLLSHAHVRRLEAEPIRDALLTATGELKRDQFGPPVDGGSNRRSIYVRVRRNSLDPFLRTFDFPEPFSATGRRDATNVPAQSLVWMNDERVHDLARRWSSSVLADQSLETDDERVQRMFVTALSRTPRPDELAAVRQFLTETQSALAETSALAKDLERRINEHRAAAAAMIAPVRERLSAERQTGESDVTIPTPVAAWEFDGDASDSIGSAHGELRDGARIEDGALILDGRGHVVTAPLGRTLKSKTLEAWIRLDNLQQRGGGVISVQSTNGAVFDAIVFGEKQPGHWLAGSNHFSRTRPFNGEPETAATADWVHIAIVYDRDGRITGYRNGRPYGESYQSDGPVTFGKGETIVSLGLRHLPAGGNRLLTGRIERARVYADALSAGQVRASAGASGRFVSDEDVLAAMTAKQRRTHSEYVAAIGQLESELANLGPNPTDASRERVWRQLALAMLALKEFVHLR